jgi:4-amino-4-deoxy-L-arabinose transferase-like glycosyltransferase
LLENTLSVFVLAAAWAYFKFAKTKKLAWLLLAGGLLATAFFTKGFVALYVWVLPALYAWFLVEKFSLKTALVHNVLFVLATTLPALLYIWLVPDAALMTQLYIQKQVVGSIQSVVTVTSRFFILGDFFLKILLPILLVGVFYFFAKRSKSQISFAKGNNHLALVLFITALCGVLPIMISLKQRSFYIVSVYPFVALAISSLTYPFFERMNLWLQTKRARTLAVGMFALAIATIFMLVTFGVGRDQMLRRDVAAVQSFTGAGAVLKCDTTTHLSESIIHAYLQRDGRLSMGMAAESNYFLAKSGQQTGDSILYKGEYLWLYQIAKGD